MSKTFAMIAVLALMFSFGACKKEDDKAKAPENKETPKETPKEGEKPAEPAK